MAGKKKRGRGRALDALISARAEAPAHEQDAAAETQSDGMRVIELDPRIIERNPRQPRISFNEEALEELAQSIRRDGVQEPVIVRKQGGVFQLVTGERRGRASILAGLKTIPAIRREVPDEDMLKLGLIENIQRENLNAIELAHAYQRLIEETGWTQEELADQVGKKRATVTNTLRLLNLPKSVQEYVADGSISMGHARALLSLQSPETQTAACRKIIEKGLSVRQAEKLAEPASKAARPFKPKDPNVASIEDELRRRLGTRVTVHNSGQNRGRIEIEYYNLDDLERILELLRR